MASYANADSQFLTYVTLATSKHVDDDFFNRWRKDHLGQTVTKGEQGDDASTLEWRVVDASHPSGIVRVTTEVQRASQKRNDLKTVSQASKQKFLRGVSVAREVEADRQKFEDLQHFSDRVCDDLRNSLEAASNANELVQALDAASAALSAAPAIVDADCIITLVKTFRDTRQHQENTKSTASGDTLWNKTVAKSFGFLLRCVRSSSTLSCGDFVEAKLPLGIYGKSCWRPATVISVHPTGDDKTNAAAATVYVIEFVASGMPSQRTDRCDLRWLMPKVAHCVQLAVEDAWDEWQEVTRELVASGEWSGVTTSCNAAVARIADQQLARQTNFSTVDALHNSGAVALAMEVARMCQGADEMDLEATAAALRLLVRLAVDASRCDDSGNITAMVDAGVLEWTSVMLTNFFETPQLAESTSLEIGLTGLMWNLAPCTCSSCIGSHRLDEKDLAMVVDALTCYLDGHARAVAQGNGSDPAIQHHAHVLEKKLQALR